MTGPRARKVFRDLWNHRGRSALAVLAMAAGVFQIGAMLYKHALLQPELEGMYGRTHPSSATLVLDHVTDALIDSVKTVPGVAAAEARPVVLARVRVGEDEWMPALLYVVRDFDHQAMDTFVPDRGAWPPASGEVLIERSALKLEGVAELDTMALAIGGEELPLRIAGTVHAVGLAPAWMEHMIPGFVTWDSPARIAETAQLRIVTDHPLEEGYIREVADSVKTMLERGGHTVTRIDVPTPGKHPHAAQMAAFLYLLLAFGILSFALSTLMVAGMIHALMSEQVKQVAMMKAIGATSRQIAGIYLAEVGILAALALVIGIPLGLLAGRAYAEFAAGILNADITRAPFPTGLVIAEVIAGILIPMLVALGPVLRAAKISVHEALNADAPARPFGMRRSDRWLTGLAWLPRPLALSLRTTFVRPGRLALTIFTLAAGGAVFISALNVSGAWTRAVDDDFDRRRYDLTVVLAEPEPLERWDAVLTHVDGVTHAEYWAGASPYLIEKNGVAGGSVSLIGPDPESKLLDLRLVEGRWLQAGDPQGAVVNGMVLNRNPTLALGDSVAVRLKGRTVTFPIVGVVKELTPMAAIYAPRQAVLLANQSSGERSRTARVVVEGDDREVARRVERAFAEAGLEVVQLQRMEDAKKGILDHLVIIMAVLTMASLIVVFVGAIGLTSTLMLNVVQRTREIGVLSAIGASPRTIAFHIVVEALLIAVLSWVLANLLAAPVTAVLEAQVGTIFFRSPLEFWMSPLASAAWLALATVLATISSFVPARRAARLTVREALAHV